MSELLTPSPQAGTAAAGGSIRELPKAPATASALARRAAALRDEVGLLDSDVRDVHRQSQDLDLDDRTALFALSDPHDLIRELASTSGLSWSAVAKLIGVSDTAVRKWRRGDAIAPENRRQIARAYALLEMLGEYPIGDPASWMEVRISADATVIPIDLYISGRADLLFELAGARMSPATALDTFDPMWRSTYALDPTYAVVHGPDGEPAIAERQAGTPLRPPVTPRG